MPDIRTLSEGYAGPFRAVTEAQAIAYREEIEREVLSTDGPDARSRYQSRHLDSPVVYQLCTAPVIIARVRAILGADIVLWRSNFFPKLAADGELRWHRDRAHWGDLLVPMVNISAWIALDPATTENGCVEVIPNSQDLRDSETPQERFIAVPSAVAEGAIAMQLRPGQFFLFDEGTIHRSLPNNSPQNRLALVARFTVAGAIVRKERLFPSHRLIALPSSKA